MHPRVAISGTAYSLMFHKKNSKNGKKGKKKTVAVKVKHSTVAPETSSGMEPFILDWLSSMRNAVSFLRATGINDAQIQIIRKVWSAPSLSWSIMQNPFKDGRSDLLARTGMSQDEMDIFLTLPCAELASKAHIWVEKVLDEFVFVWYFYGKPRPNDMSAEEWLNSSNSGKLFLSDLISHQSRNSSRGGRRGRRTGRAGTLVAAPIMGLGLDKDQKTALKRLMKLKFKGFAKKALHQHKEVVKNIKGKVDLHSLAVAAHSEKIQKRHSIKKAKLQAKLQLRYSKKLQNSVKNLVMIKNVGAIQPVPHPPNSPPRYQVFFDRAKEDGAAALLQAVIRGHAAREKLKAQAKAITKVQALFRGSSLRGFMQEALKSLTEQDADFVRATLTKTNKNFITQLTRQLDPNNTGIMERAGVLALLEKFRVSHPQQLLAQMGAGNPEVGVKITDFKAWLNGKKIKMQAHDQRKKVGTKSAVMLDREAAASKIQALHRGNEVRVSLLKAFENLEIDESAFVRTTVARAGPNFLKAIESRLDPTNSGEMSRFGVLSLLKKLKVTRPEPILKKMGSFHVGMPVKRQAFRDWLDGKESVAEKNANKKHSEVKPKSDAGYSARSEAATKIQALRRGTATRKHMENALTVQEEVESRLVKDTLNKAGWPFLQALFKQLDPGNSGFLQRAGILSLM